MRDIAQFILVHAAKGSRCYGGRVADQIYGPAASDVRQAIMQALQGAKVPKSKCGATAVREALYARFGVARDCIASMDAALQVAIETAARGEVPHV